MVGRQKEGPSRRGVLTGKLSGKDASQDVPFPRGVEYPANTRRIELADGNGTVVQFLSQHDIVNPAEDLMGANGILLEGGLEAGSYSSASEVIDTFKAFSSPRKGITPQYKELLQTWSAFSGTSRQKLFFIDLPGADILTSELRGMATAYERYARNAILVVGGLYTLSSEDGGQVTRRALGTLAGAFLAVPHVLGRGSPSTAACEDLIDHVIQHKDDEGCIRELSESEKALIEDMVTIALRDVCFAYKSTRANEMLRQKGISAPISHAFTGSFHLNTSRLLKKTAEELLQDFERIITSLPKPGRYAQILLDNHAYRIPEIISPADAMLHDDVALKDVLVRIASKKP